MTVPNLVMEPIEKGGELTFLQHCRPCIIVDVDPGKVVTIKNTRFILKRNDDQRHFFQKAGMKISASEIFGQDAKSFSQKAARLQRNLQGGAAPGNGTGNEPSFVHSPYDT